VFEIEPLKRGALRLHVRRTYDGHTKDFRLTTDRLQKLRQRLPYSLEPFRKQISKITEEVRDDVKYVSVKLNDEDAIKAAKRLYTCAMGFLDYLFGSTKKSTDRELKE
jgi:hypothetical protein